MLTSDSGMQERRETGTNIYTGGNTAKSHRTARYAEVTWDCLLMTRGRMGPLIL